MAKLDMNSKILCTWLGLPEQVWPPDHYTLLGLRQGEADVGRIEQIVHERMAKLRCYQLSHPEEATEGMNRLAQAFISLTESLSKQATSSPTPKTPETPKPNGKVPAAPKKSKDETLSGEGTISDWHVAPPPVRATQRNGAGTGSSPDVLATPPPQPPVPETPETTVPETPSAEATPPVLDVPVAKPYEAPPSPEPADIVYELAHQSPEAQRGIGTLSLLVDRIYQTRQLIIAWNHAGKHLANPNRKLTRAADGTDLSRRLTAISALMNDYPTILGHPGKPGYRVVAMGRLALTADMFKMLDADQRSALARDWDAGYRVLLSHRQFLRQQFKTLRRQGYLALAMKAVRGAINDHPRWVALGASLAIAIVVCLWLLVF